MNGFKIIVLAKQVPDTRNVGKDAMKEDGTVNRAALPAIFNPEDLNALELALQVKDKYPDSEVIILTMGPPRAADIIREAIYRGADKGYLITDRRFAGSDTLATSYAISQAVKKIGDFDLIFAGRQAIDGDTAQVGPQAAEKIGIPQITYAEELVSVEKGKIMIKRRLENGVETVAAPMPVLITVHGSAPDCRPRHAKRLMKYKYALTKTEMQNADDFSKELVEKRPYLLIEEWSVDDIQADVKWLGLSGSPTKVKKVENIVLAAKEAKQIDTSDEQLEEFIKELIENHTIG
ncbi:MAG: electron transfer flavoprotein subunit beta/FixA family protein [Bacteroidales bacterium]|nr:electron transfer flavoprotein subunit beta/FixA family protein [Bacteroidales bacterium]